MLCVLALFVYFWPVVTTSNLAGIVATLVVISAIACCPATYFIANVSSSIAARRQVPRGSRRFDRTFDRGSRDIDRVLDTDRFVCANCGGSLEVKAGMATVQCGYCGVTNEIVIR
jgi:hypothetical protein